MEDGGFVRINLSRTIRPSDRTVLTQDLPDDCPVLDPPFGGTCFRKNPDGKDYMRQRCENNPKCAGWSCKTNPADGCWLIGSGYVALEDAKDQSVWLKVGQAVTIGGNFTRVGMPGSVVINKDCASINSMAKFVDPVNCCKKVGHVLIGASEIACSPDGSRVKDMYVSYQPGAADDPCYFKDCPEVSMDALTTLTELNNLSFTLKSPSFRAPIPKDLFRLENLKGLYLSWDIYGEIPASIANVTNLSYLDLSALEIPKFPDSLSKTPVKTIFFSKVELSRILAGNQLTSLDGVRDIPNLEKLDLNSNAIEGFPLGLGTLKKLKTMITRNLSNNRLESIDGLQNCNILQSLNLKTNFLKRLPATVARLASLTLMFEAYHKKPKSFSDLSSNSLQSFDGIENFVNLQTLNCNSNGIQKLPASFGNLKNLKAL
ncbi:hypothetical protein HDU97_001988 [Phlyctochytrium planicorne]|nr:hypothetical protein HDU97_001988 [Phlyctochytrium planicorne]